jgi:hypothetical protein
MSGDGEKTQPLITRIFTKLGPNYPTALHSAAPHLSFSASPLGLAGTDNPVACQIGSISKIKPIFLPQQDQPRRARQPEC